VTSEPFLEPDPRAPEQVPEQPVPEAPEQPVPEAPEQSEQPVPEPGQDEQQRAEQEPVGYGVGDDLRRPRREPGPPADGLAVAALVVAIVGVPLVAVVLGHLALARIRDRGTGGRGMAIAALVLGYVGVVLTLALVVVYFAVLAPLITLPG
jgi:hypothetical protein